MATIFVFRRRLPGVERPYRCWGYPIVPLLYLILPAYIFVTMLFKQTLEAGTGLAFMGLGVIVYALVFRNSRPMVPERTDQT